ncbi:putative phage tail protein [Yersinia intermedia]|nr:putative phage tail protein [Yersinia intermedia]
MAWYRTGRASSVAGSNVITGVGTLWANNVFGIAPGQTLSIPGGGPVLQYEILAVDSDTKIRIATNATATVNNSEYAISTTVANSYSALARQTSANLAVYEKLLSDWNHITTGTGNVTIIAPDGTNVVMPSFNQMNINIENKAAKGVNADITALNALTKAITIAQGGTGATTVPLARTALGLGSAAVADVVANSADQTAGRAMTTGSNGIGGQAVNYQSVNNAFLHPNGTMGFVTATNWGGTTPTDTSGNLPAHWNVISFGVGNGQVVAGSRKSIIAIQSYNVGSGAPQCYVRTIHDTALSPAVMLYHTNNTTVDSNGFLKKASPVVKLYGDGSSETNHESDGAASERISEGVYKISGVLGFNSDDAWGGVDGGIEIPTDKNKQPLIWVDYSLEEDGDLIIKTYHRTHPASPQFAQNNIKGYEDGQPIDIPLGRFVDLRVQMPEREETELPLTEE